MHALSRLPTFAAGNKVISDMHLRKLFFLLCCLLPMGMQAQTINGRLGFSYDFNDRHSIGVRYKFNAVKSKYKGTGAGQDAKARF